LFAWESWSDELRALATSISFDWSPGLQVRWDWTGEQYVRYTGGEPHQWIPREGDPEQLSTDTLIVLFARRYTASPSGAGSSVPAMDTVGTGRALVFSGGEVREGTWSRDAIEEPFALQDGDGATLTVPPGRPWISVFPDSRSITWVSDE
jgi:hypothetical protein